MSKPSARTTRQKENRQKSLRAEVVFTEGNGGDLIKVVQEFQKGHDFGQLVKSLLRVHLLAAQEPSLVEVMSRLAVAIESLEQRLTTGAALQPTHPVVSKKSNLDRL